MGMSESRDKPATSVSQSNAQEIFDMYYIMVYIGIIYVERFSPPWCDL
jgi:hypothetical protein